MLSKRLQTVYDNINDAQIVADIGTDHGYIPIALINNNKATKVYASDIAEGPLNNAKKNIETLNLQDKIIPVLSNGLDNIPNDIDTIVIAGMGFYKCEEILEDNLSKLYLSKQIIVQVNRDVGKLRRWISNHHFTIVNEDIVYEGMYYQVIVFNCNYHRAYSDLEIALGPILMQNQSPLFIEYLEYLLLKQREIFENVPEHTERYRELRKDIKSLESILKVK